MPHYSSFWGVFIVLVVSVNVRICLSCVSEEEQALLAFKSSLNEIKYAHHALLRSWDDQVDQDCCYWPGVECSNVTGERRIVQLNLQYLQYFDTVNPSYDDQSENSWYQLNMSTLSPLKYLQALDLSDNLFIGLIGCEGLADLKNLETLYLEANNFNGSIFRCLSAFSSLQSLSLAYNHFEGSFPVQELKQLKHLDLSYNQISAPLVSTGICSLNNLIELDLGGNEFSGEFPKCISNLTSLRFLVMSHNNFSGNIPHSVIASLVHLEYLSLQHNHFEGPFPFSLLSNHSKLQGLTLGSFLGTRGFCIDFEGVSVSQPSTLQLRVLSLSNCNLGQFPKFLYSQKQLRLLDLSSNNIADKIPISLLENNPHLKILHLRNNSFEGTLLMDSKASLLDLTSLDISNNKFSGQVSENFGSFFPSLNNLNLSRNKFEGSIPESIGYLKNLIIMDLSNNNFSGKVPEKIGIDCSTLWALRLSNNSLRGHFPSSSMNLTSLIVLHLDNNHFEGNISLGLSRSRALKILDMSNNKFEGEIPNWIGNFSSMQILDLSQNYLEGTIPNEICKLSALFLLNLSLNQFNGSMLSCSSLINLMVLHLQRNQLTGSIPDELLKGSKNLVNIDFRNNRLSRALPFQIASVVNLKIFLLGKNNFQGNIPLDICHLKQLTILDLSQNEFSGQIPWCLGDITFKTNGSIPLHVDYNFGMGFPDEYGTSSFDSSYLPGGDFYYQFSSFTQEIVEFTTKNRINMYSGNILNYMSGVDLSDNQLTGKIPSGIGGAHGIRALNLSHNHLQGTIPSELSLLNLVESLDLSYNSFTGQIPHELTNLNFLSNFNGSYNNLSGKTPEHGQFATFNEDNYRGNPNLCGTLLQTHCKRVTNAGDIHHPVSAEEIDGEAIDMETFSWSFFVALFIALATLALCLFLNPKFCRAWFGFIDTWILPRFYHRYEHWSFK